MQVVFQLLRGWNILMSLIQINDVKVLNQHKAESVGYIVITDKYNKDKVHLTDCSYKRVKFS
jgi:hypothetical protein